MRLLLASKSPRRRQLLAELGLPLTVVDVEVEEVVPEGTPVAQIPEFLACLKASGYTRPLAPDEVLVTADTIVELDGRVMGKPHTRECAIEMLRALSGRRHTVFSGVCLSTASTRRSFTETTYVCFKSLSDKEILYYVDHCSCLDKAGAYGIQDWIGMVGVERIEGCYYNVVGLPLSRLYHELQTLPISMDWDA